MYNKRFPAPAAGSINQSSSLSDIRPGKTRLKTAQGLAITSGHDERLNEVSKREECVKLKLGHILFHKGSEEPSKGDIEIPLHKDMCKYIKRACPIE